jgi:predicted acyltransferase
MVAAPLSRYAYSRRVDQRRSPHHANTHAAPQSLRYSGQAWFERFAGPRTASQMFALCGILVIFAVLVFCHRRRWILNF